MKLPQLIQLIIVCNLALVVVSGSVEAKMLPLHDETAGCDSKQAELNLRKKSEISDYWLEYRMFSFRDAFFCKGPSVVRCRNKPVFIWQTTTYRPWGIDKHTPYVLVIESEKSMALLTNFLSTSTEVPVAMGISGWFQDDQFSGRVDHTYKPSVLNEEGEALSDPTFAEEFFFTLNGKKKMFDLNEGRVFVLRKNKASKDLEVVQQNVALPDVQTLRSDVRMDGTAEFCYGCFYKWWESVK